MRMFSSAGLVLGFGALTFVEPQQVKPPTISVETDLVTMSVTVVDRHGGFVTDLAQDNFKVYDHGQQKEIQFFSSEDLPATVGLVVDSSSSMWSSRNAVTAAGVAFASMSHPLDELFTINFNEAVWPGLPPSIAFTESAEQLRMVLAAAPARGKTALYDAVDRALDHLQLGSRDRKALIVVSDGGDNASTQTLTGVLDRVRRAEASIYAVAIYEPGDEDANPGVLTKLARETGGDVFTPTRADAVVTAFARIGRELRTGYTIGFSPTEDGGEFRPVRVVADGGKDRQLIVRTRAGYYAGRHHEPAIK